jgi:hypothetical protein
MKLIRIGNHYIPLDKPKKAILFEFKLIVSRLLINFKYIAFAILCLIFVLAIGAGYGLNLCNSKHTVHKHRGK